MRHFKANSYEDAARLADRLIRDGIVAYPRMFKTGWIVVAEMPVDNTENKKDGIVKKTP